MGLSRGCVHQEDLDDVALAVGFTDQDLTLRGPDNFNDDSVVVSEVFWHLDGEDFMLLDIIKFQSDHGIRTSGLGILDLSDFWVIRQLSWGLLARWVREEVLDGVVGDRRLVCPQERDMFAVARPPGPTVACQDFFLVHPVRHTIEEVIPTILGDGNDGLRGQIAQIQVVVANEHNRVRVGRPASKLHPVTQVRGVQRLGLLRLHIKDPVLGIIGMSPVGCHTRRDQDLFQVRTRPSL